MKRMTNLIAAAVISISLLPGRAFAAELLVPVGKVVGLELQDDCVTVADFDEHLGATAREAGLKIGDEIQKIDDISVDSVQDVRTALDRSDGDIELLISRNGKQHRLTLVPQATAQGPRLGICLRQGIAGIGTVTYYDPQSGSFGALGHGVNRPDGEPVFMTEGKAYYAAVEAVRKGKSGAPGQLMGTVTDTKAFANLDRNMPQGVFGKAKGAFTGEPLPVAAISEIQTGPAAIRSTTQNGTIREYSVEILKVYPGSGADGRNMLLQVTDPELLSTTGGIVQGMSGSPIIQDGKLVGAVTHVLVNDPTRGYGIFIENMLEAAS